jgi:hypothetical protein
MAQHAPPRGASLLRISAELRVPVRRVDLQRMVDDVAAEHATRSAPSELEQHMARCMARRGLHQQLVVDRVRPFEQARLPGLDHRQHAVAVADPAIRRLGQRRIPIRIPVVVFDAGEEILRVRKRRHPAPIP